MNFPPLLAQTKMIAVHERNGARWALTCAGTPGWCMQFAHGVCVALSVERADVDDEWLVRATLSLATLRGALDDSLVLDGDALWFVRRYAPDLDDAALEAALAQQQGVAHWLAGKENDLSPFAGACVGALG